VSRYDKRAKSGSVWARGGKRRWKEKPAKDEALALVDRYVEASAAILERMANEGEVVIKDGMLTMRVEDYSEMVFELAGRAAEVYRQWKGKDTAEAIKALRIYGAHTIQCNKGIEGASCDCGLDAALEAVKKLSAH